MLAKVSADDRGQRSGLAYEDPRRVEGLTGRGNPFVTVSGGPGSPRDGAREYAAAVERGAAVGVNEVALGAGIGPEEGAEEVLRDADGLHGVRSGGAEYRREVAVVPSPRCWDGRRAGDREKGDRNK